MTRDPASIKALKNYYNDKLAPLDIQEMEKELLGTNDRALVIILGTLIDDALQYLLATRMRKLNDTDFSETFRFNGPLGPFSNRIEMSFVFGLIEPDLRERLHELREMHNACAHCRRHISFETPQLANVAKRFLKDALFKLQGDTLADIRLSMSAECFFLFNVLISSREEAMAALKKALEKASAAETP